jgi:hypothetical protein
MLISKQKKDFTLKIKDFREHGENIVFIKGGSVVLENQWVFFPDLKIDVQATVQAYVSDTSRRIFNNFNDFLYVLLVLNKGSQIEVIPSVSYNKSAFGDIKVFPSLSGKLPLVLVRLTQDGSADLKSFVPIKPGDMELYQGYGNFTVKGDKGVEGFKGITGVYGLTGFQGLTGVGGITGFQGLTGLPGCVLQGVTGPAGSAGVSMPAFVRSDLLDLIEFNELGVIVERGLGFIGNTITEDGGLPDSITED